VVPEKLQAARKIRKYFTGNLQHRIVSYPPFDSTEAQYLRCQIARISAATVASPAGYYTFDPEESENGGSDGGDGEGGHQQTIIINPEFEGLPNEALTQLSNWVHHVPYILPQGRVTWENPIKSYGNPNGENGGENEDGENEDEGSDSGNGGSDEDGSSGNGSELSAEPESGPQILSPLSADDESADGTPSWVARTASRFAPSKFAPAVLRSTRWEGAIVVAYNDKFANLYVGDGLRDVAHESGLFVPPSLPVVQKEFVLPQENKEAEEEEDEEKKKAREAAAATAGMLVEQKDPTVEEEEAFEEARKAKEEEGKGEEEEEGEGEEGEGEEED
jgi:radial spoke head protein 4A